ncbi:hypothetical protein ACHAXT_001705 [Thalassiosira profunda]
MALSPPSIVRARVAAVSEGPSSDTSHEPSCSSDHGEGRAALLGLHLKRSDDHDGSIVVYHIEERSQAAELPVGCEILAVNGRRIKGGGSACRAAEVLDYFARKYGEVDILASHGERPRGSLYLVAKNDRGILDTADVFTGSYSTVDGLELEETEGGRVRVASSAVPLSGVFRGLRLNRGDAIVAVDGVGVSSIDGVRGALIEASRRKHQLLPILTYNVFRRLRTTVMATTMLAGTRGWDAALVARQVNIADDYDVHEKLGEGAFAVVKKATRKETGETCAIKIVNRSSLNKEVEAALQQEIEILKELDHRHIMRLDNVVVTIKNYYLVAEYLEGGELFDRIVEKSSYTESEARDVCRILFDALSYMSERGIVHRDLKPENLLLQYKHSDSEIKIADFGFAKKATNDHSLDTMCGTPGYVAPEILNRETYGTKVDMWSMGVILFIMLGGYPPFYADNPRELLRLTKKGQFEFDPEYWGEISGGAKDMICSLIVTDPAKRSSADDVLAHPWINEDKRRLRQMSLAKTQVELKKYLARMRFKKAIHSILFVNTFTGANAVFAGRNKRNNIKELEKMNSVHFEVGSR